MESHKLNSVQKRYLNGLKAYKRQGIKVLIDGLERPEKEWDMIFRVSEPDTRGITSFYMADFIAAPHGEISEIRLDKVSIREL